LAFVSLDEVPLCNVPTGPKVSGHQFVQGTVESVLNGRLRKFELKSKKICYGQKQKLLV
jgi:hypothetical protein